VALRLLSKVPATVLVTALGLLPLAIGMEDPGREIEGPMALVILGVNDLDGPEPASPAHAGFNFGRFESAVDELAGEFPYDTPL
jgi:hypothetical protein